jgi:hypothetical protein
MEYIMIAIMIIVGLIGIIKNKWPKYENGLGFAINANFYFLFYFLFIVGIGMLVIRIRQ